MSFKSSAQALHTAARRYCQSKSNYWYQIATELQETKPCDPSSYRQTLLDNYACSKVLMMICTELEKLDPEKLVDIENTRELIVHIGRVAQEFPQRPNMGQTSVRQVVQSIFGINTEDAIAKEREAFCTYIKELSDSQLKFIQPLPYQRVLSPAESSTMWQKLRARWHINGWYWHPLIKCELSNVTAFNVDAFEAFFSSFNLIEMLSSRGITRVWELREYGVEYYQDVLLFDPIYNGYEGYWTSDCLDWIVYASHEASVTVGGWLLENIKTQWSEWEQHVW
ncbi:MAG TPA: hypothetical protein V6D19_26115 [Stenomitos sp.]